MPLQNRVLPDGQIVIHPARGMMMGNRGILHDDARQLGGARWRHANWICCEIAFRGRQRRPMTPGRYTELFFLDEAVALAAGHRPCAECRRSDYHAWRAAWGATFGSCGPARDMDRLLHAARTLPRSTGQRRHSADLAALPDGAFVLWQDSPHLVRGSHLCPFEPHGYGAPLPRPLGDVTVLTPEPTIAVLAAGYRPRLHPTAGSS